MKLRQWFEEVLEDDSTRARAIVERVLETGLEPVTPPSLLPPIVLEDIELLCWMGIEENPPEG